MNQRTESCKQASAFTPAHLREPTHVAKEADSVLLGTAVTQKISWKQVLEICATYIFLPQKT